MKIKQTIYKKMVTYPLGQNVKLEIEAVLEGSGNPADTHKIVGVIIKENGSSVSGIGDV